MDTTAKSKFVKETAERARDVSGATAEAADVIKNSVSTAIDGITDYNSKLVEFSQANIKSYVEFAQRLATVKSPSEFFEMSNDHARRQLEKMAEQAKQLSEITQKVALASAQPLKASLANPKAA